MTPECRYSASSTRQAELGRKAYHNILLNDSLGAPAGMQALLNQDQHQPRRAVSDG
jgi:hypothetical protein